MQPLILLQFFIFNWEEKMTKQVRRIIYIVLFCEFLICLGMSLIFPVEPFIKSEYHFSAFDMGMMSSLFAFVQFLASPIVGRLSDNIGRKPLLIWGLVIFSIAEFVFAAANHLWLFNISRAVDGLSAAMFVPTSMALAADITTREYRAKVIGWLSAAFSGGLMLGPGIGGILAGISFKAPFWVAGILGVLSTIIAIFALPSEETIERAEPVHHHRETEGSTGWSAIKKMLTPSMTILFIMILVSAFGLAGFESIYSIYVNEVHGFSLGEIALVLTVNGVLSLLLQLFLFDWLVVHLSEVVITRWSFFFAVVGTIIIIYDHTNWHIFLATLLVYESFDLLRPAITTLLTKLTEENQGLLNGINMSLTSIGNVIGPLLSGALLDMNYQYPFWLVSVFLLLSFFITLGMGHLKNVAGCDYHS